MKDPKIPMTPGELPQQRIRLVVNLPPRIPFRDTNRMLFTISSRHRLKIRSVHFEKR